MHFMMYICVYVYLPTICVYLDFIGYGFVDFESASDAKIAVSSLQSLGILAQFAKVSWSVLEIVHALVSYYLCLNQHNVKNIEIGIKNPFVHQSFHAYLKYKGHL